MARLIGEDAPPLKPWGYLLLNFSSIELAKSRIESLNLPQALSTWPFWRSVRPSLSSFWLPKSSPLFSFMVPVPCLLSPSTRSLSTAWATPANPTTPANSRAANGVLRVYDTRLSPASGSGFRTSERAHRSAGPELARRVQRLAHDKHRAPHRCSPPPRRPGARGLRFAAWTTGPGEADPRRRLRVAG